MVMSEIQAEHFIKYYNFYKHVTFNKLYAPLKKFST